MLRSGTVAAAVLMFAWLPGCGPPAEASSPPSPSAEPSAGGEPAAAGSGEASTEGAPATSEGGKGDKGEKAEKGEASGGGSVSEGTSLGRDFLKSGGRRIGYSATKKMFAYPFETRRATGFSLDIHFMSADGNLHDSMRVCQFGECEEHLDEMSKAFLPKLTSRLDGDGYVAIRGIGWPDGRDELEVSTLSMKLRYAKGQFSVVKDGKAGAGFAGIGKRMDAKSPLAIFVVPDTKLLAVFAQPGGGGVVQELYLVKLP